MSDYLLYFAYGSNLHPMRLGERLPYCRFVRTDLIKGYQLRFHQTGQDNSAKCDAYYTGDLQDSVYGAIFEIKRSERPVLDQYESLGEGYHIVWPGLDVTATAGDVFMYQAMPEYIDSSLRPFDWYKEFVMLGARYHDFPASYCEAINKAVSTRDDDIPRRERAERILKQMR